MRTFTNQELIQIRDFVRTFTTARHLMGDAVPGMQEEDFRNAAQRSMVQDRNGGRMIFAYGVMGFQAKFQTDSRTHTDLEDVISQLMERQNVLSCLQVLAQTAVGVDAASLTTTFYHQVRRSGQDPVAALEMALGTPVAPKEPLPSVVLTDEQTRLLLQYAKGSGVPETPQAALNRFISTLR